MFNKCVNLLGLIEIGKPEHDRRTKNLVKKIWHDVLKGAGLI